MAVGITLVVFIIVAILYAVLCTRYRERWCAREGFEDLGKVSDEWYHRLRVHQHCFGEGDVGHVGSCLRKVIDGRTLWQLEHEWRTGSINDRRAVWKTFVIWELNEPGLPHFTLSQRTPLVVQALATVIRAILFIPYLLFLRPHKAPLLRGFAPAEDNSDFSEEFARRYQVTGDPDATRKLLTRDVQACFCEKPFAGSLVAIDRMLIWQSPGLLTPSNLDEKWDVALKLRQLFLK